MGWTADGKYQIPNSRHQITNKFQAPNSNVQNRGTLQHLLFVWVIGSLAFGAYLVFDAYDLEF
jgi:hypothetical protein